MRAFGLKKPVFNLLSQGGVGGMDFLMDAGFGVGGLFWPCRGRDP